MFKKQIYEKVDAEPAYHLFLDGPCSGKIASVWGWVLQDGKGLDDTIWEIMAVNGRRSIVSMRTEISDKLDYCIKKLMGKPVHKALFTWNFKSNE